MDESPDESSVNRSDEPFLSRWARRKKLTNVSDTHSTTDESSAEPATETGLADTGLADTDATPSKADTEVSVLPDVEDPGSAVVGDDVQELQTGAVVTDAAEHKQVDADETEVLLTDEDMPPIETLSKDSDVSCFFNKGVSDTLRKKALRHLFMLPAFNIRDGLNDYDEDYTVFEPLGDTVTSDMKFHAARKAREEEERRLAMQQDDAEESAGSESLDPEHEVAGAEQEEPVETEPEENLVATTDEPADPDSDPNLNQPPETTEENNEMQIVSAQSDTDSPEESVVPARTETS